MNPTLRTRFAFALLLVAAATVRAAAGDPPPSSLDLGATKPKSDSGAATTPGGIQPIGQSLISKKAAADAAAAATPAKAGIGTAVKSPLGTKGVLGGPASGTPGPAAPEDTASSNDVVVKMPSNTKK